MSIENSQIVWPINFVATVFTEEKILPNSYNINISIIPIENVNSGISVGYKKIKYFVDSFLHNSVFISLSNPVLPGLNQTENNIVVFPQEPYDFHIGSILYSKFVAISEKYFHIDVINIDSIVGDNICYSVSYNDLNEVDNDSNLWWNIDSTYTGHGEPLGWGDIAEYASPKFEPKIIKGGKKSEH